MKGGKKLLFLKIGTLIKNKLVPITYWLVQYRLHYMECNEETCDYKGYSKRVVSILNILILFILTGVAMVITKEIVYSILGFLAIMGIMTFFGSERCPRCMTTDINYITQEDYMAYVKKYEEDVKKAREEVDQIEKAN